MRRNFQFTFGFFLSKAKLGDSSVRNIPRRPQAGALLRPSCKLSPPAAARVGVDGSPVGRSAVGGSVLLPGRVSRDACLCLLRVRDYEYELCVFWAGSVEHLS